MSVQKVLQNLKTLKKWQIPNPNLHPKAKIGDTIINTLLVSDTNTTVLSNLNPSLVHLILSDPHINTPKCIDFFNYLLLNQSLITFKIGVETHLNLVCRLVKERCFDDAENLLVLVPQIETFRCPFSVVASFFENHNVPSKFASKIFNLLLKALSDNGKFQEVLDIFMYMRLNAIEINERTCTVHLIKLLKSDQIALALVFFYQMIESGLQVSVFSLTVLVDGLCKNGEIKKARELVEEMLLFKGLKPNIITCNTLVDACAKRWKFEEMENVLALMNRERVDLNAETYKFLVDGFLSGGKIDDAERLMLEMYVKGFKVDIHLYNLMIKGYCRLENTERALSLFRQMIEKDVCPNIDTYSVLVKGLCDVGQVSVVKELVDKMVGQGVELDGSVFDVLIECYFKAGMIEEAVGILALMEKRGFIADISVYELIIDGLLKLDRTEEAIPWLTPLIKRGVSRQKLATIPLVDHLRNEKLVHKCEEKENSFDTSFYSDTISLWLGKQHEDAHSAEMMNISAVENEYIKGNAA